MAASAAAITTSYSWLFCTLTTSCPPNMGEAEADARIVLISPDGGGRRCEEDRGCCQGPFLLESGRGSRLRLRLLLHPTVAAGFSRAIFRAELCE